MTKRHRSTSRRIDQEKFWGRQDREPASADPIRPTPEPGALVRSLGALPLAVDRDLAERHVVAVYEEAVRTATALAAASGILSTDG